jgi:hypothetical protein
VANNVNKVRTEVFNVDHGFRFRIALTTAAEIRAAASESKGSRSSVMILRTRTVPPFFRDALPQRGAL